MGESMGQGGIVFSLFLIFTGAAVLATGALFARQALPVAYIVLGVLIGPHGAGLIVDPSAIRAMAEVGIIFLLFLLGLDLAPSGLLHMLRKATLVTVGSSVACTQLICARVRRWVSNSGMTPSERIAFMTWKSMLCSGS